MGKGTNLGETPGRAGAASKKVEVGLFTQVTPHASTLFLIVLDIDTHHPTSFFSYYVHKHDIYVCLWPFFFSVSFSKTRV